MLQGDIDLDEAGNEMPPLHVEKASQEADQIHAAARVSQEAAAYKQAVRAHAARVT